MQMGLERAISRLSGYLKDHYDVNGMKGLMEIARDKRIVVIESPKVVIPSCQYSVRLGTDLIFTRPAKFKAIGLQFLGHELGHVLLGHTRDLRDENVHEQEADYFAKVLLGPFPYHTALLEASFCLMTQPIYNLRCVLDRRFHNQQLDKLIPEKI